MAWEKSNSESIFTENLTLDVHCIVCAAGFSSRMGRWKVDLMTRESRSFLENALMAASVCRRITLVGGYRFDELKKRVPPVFRGRVIENADFRKGMLSTVQKALAVSDGYFFILPVDMPLISGDHLRSVYQRRSEDKVVRPAYGGVPGHPVLCPPQWRERLLFGQGRSPSSLSVGTISILSPGKTTRLYWMWTALKPMSFIWVASCSRRLSEQ